MLLPCTPTLAPGLSQTLMGKGYAGVYNGVNSRASVLGFNAWARVLVVCGWSRQAAGAHCSKCEGPNSPLTHTLAYAL